MPATPQIVFDQLSCTAPNGDSIFTGLSAVLPMNRIGLVGDNGAGKTTLLRVLLGQVEPAGGRFAVTGSVGYLPQHLLQPEGGTLSGGELVRHHLGRLVAENHDFLVLDEPTNNLDVEAREGLYRLVEESTRGVLVVSHDRELLRRMDLILEMTPRSLRVYGGNYDFYRAQRAIHAAALDQDILTTTLELRKAEKLAQVMRERHERRAGAGKRAGIKANLPAIVRGAKKRQAEETRARSQGTHERVIGDLEAELGELHARKVYDNVIALDLPRTRVPNGKVVFELRDLAFGYDARRPLFTGLTRIVAGPRRLALRGRNGSGKTTLVKLLLGQLQPSAGLADVRVGSVGYLDQGTTKLPNNRTLLDMLRDVDPVKQESDVRTHLARLKFRREDVHKRIGILSGGERMRAALAAEFLKPAPPQLLILDEPTNNLDLNSIERLESALACYEGALLVISHDETFLRNVRVEDAISL